jgi:lysophospholipase L1-like esterase
MARGARQGILQVAALCVSVGIGVLAAEAGLRLIGRDSPRVWAPDPVVGWRPIPGATRRWIEEGDGLIEINSRGFRDRERQLEAAPAMDRIAVFGDSMTEADQVNLDQTYAARLEAGLRRQGHAVEVLNFGVSGYSPAQELLLFREEAAKYRPGIVVLALFLDNDVSGSHPRLSVAPEAPFAVAGNSRLSFDFSRAEASYHSYNRQPFHFLRKHFALYRAMSALRERGGETAPGGPARSGPVPTRFELYQTMPRPEWEEAWETLEHVIAAFAGDTRRLGAELVILSVPAAQVVDPRAWERLVAEHPAMREEAWDLEGPDRRLRAFAHRHDLRLIQPHEAFAAAVRSETLYFGDVGHLTPGGHALMADELARFLAADGPSVSARSTKK